MTQEPIATTELARRRDTVALGDGSAKLLQGAFWLLAAGIGSYLFLRGTTPRPRDGEPDAVDLLAEEARTIQRRNSQRRRRQR